MNWDYWLPWRDNSEEDPKELKLRRKFLPAEALENADFVAFPDGMLVKTTLR